MNHWYTTLAALLLTAPCLAQKAPSTAAVPLKSDASEKTVFIPMPPEPLCGPMVREAHWSPDGRYLCVLRRRILAIRPDLALSGDDASQVGDEVVIWSTATRKATAVWTSPPGGPAVHMLDWLPGHNTLFLVAAGMPGEAPDSPPPAVSLWRIDARRGTAVEAGQVSVRENLSISPRQPYAVFYGADEQGIYVKPVGPDGSIGAPVRLGAGDLPVGAIWGSDGSLVYVPVFTPGDGDAKSKAIYTYNARTGAVSTVNEMPKVVVTEDNPLKGDDRTLAEPKRPFRLTFSDVKVKQGKQTETVRPLWYEVGAEPDVTRVLLSGDAQDVSVSPRGDAIAYQSREGAFVVVLNPVPAEVVSAMRSKALQIQVMNQAKQVAIAAIMYADDHGEVLPNQGDDVRGQFKPYMKADNLFDAETGAFNYTFSGGPISGVENPAETMLGYFPFRGQYIVAFVDGHVRVMDSLPPPPGDAPQ